MNHLEVKIVTPEKIYLENNAEMVTLPAHEGELGIAYNHVPLLANLKTGYIKTYLNSKISHSIFIKSGILKFEDNKLVILTEEVISLDNVNKVEIKEKAKLLQEKIKYSLKTDNNKLMHESQAELDSLNILLAEI